MRTKTTVDVSHPSIVLDSKHGRRRGSNRVRPELSLEESVTGKVQKSKQQKEYGDSFPEWAYKVLSGMRWRTEHVLPYFVEQALSNIVSNGTKTPMIGLTVNPGKLHEQAYALKHSLSGLDTINKMTKAGHVVSYSVGASKGFGVIRQRGWIYSVDGVPFHKLSEDVWGRLIEYGFYKNRTPPTPGPRPSLLKREKRRKAARAASLSILPELVERTADVVASQLNGNNGSVTGTDDHPQGRRRGTADSTPLQTAMNNHPGRGTINSALETMAKVESNGKHSRNSRRRVRVSDYSGKVQQKKVETPTAGKVQQRSVETPVVGEIPKEKVETPPSGGEAKAEHVAIIVRTGKAPPGVEPAVQKVKHMVNIGIVHYDHFASTRFARLLKFLSFPILLCLFGVFLCMTEVVVEVESAYFPFFMFGYIFLVCIPCILWYLHEGRKKNLVHGISGSTYDGLTYTENEVYTFDWWKPTYNLRGLGFNAYVVREVDVGIVNDLLRKYGGVKVTSDTMRLFMAHVMQGLAKNGEYKHIDFNVARDSVVAAYQQKCLLAICGNQGTGNVGNQWSYMSPHVL